MVFYMQKFETEDIVSLLYVVLCQYYEFFTSEERPDGV